MAQFGVYVSGGSSGGGGSPPTSTALGMPCGCPGCGGRVGVYSTRVVGRTRLRYLACKTCGAPAGKQIVPIDFSPPRR